MTGAVAAGRRPGRNPPRTIAYRLSRPGDHARELHRLTKRPARLLRVASASSMPTLTNFTSVLGCSWPIRSMSAEMSFATSSLMIAVAIWKMWPCSICW
jgi:hypothetical protein